MKLSINPSEWNVLTKQMINGGVNPENANYIINQHKKILQEYKEKLEYAKRTEIEKFKRKLDKLSIRNKQNKILKFENEIEEKINNDFKNKFWKIAQQIEGRF